MIDFITFCDYTGTFAFAISGIRLASAKQFDWFGAYVIGVVTAVGGGTIRDILLNATPFWMEQASYLIISALALLFVIIFRKYVISLNNTFFIRRDRAWFVWRGRYRESACLRFSHVGGYRDGDDHGSFRRYDP